MPEDGIVMDPFAGSGTTGHAVLDMNREGDKRTFIMMEQGNEANDDMYARSLTYERVKAVIGNDNLSFFELSNTPSPRNLIISSYQLSPMVVMTRGFFYVMFSMIGALSRCKAKPYQSPCDVCVFSNSYPGNRSAINEKAINKEDAVYRLLDKNGENQGIFF
ncbi:hypothetical protein B0W47_16540 (plasmid) [Komagataeibacter nataicola]|uniref:site-specific DNA-methyltransferase (adenine-specific) n=1 Tax=Komagataeibacter nataicola TaxID=265960 RepID=A0A9N7D0B8_9PROT|nr:DNA methyltransferase [Komagataeibacter nataicola]AQU89251.1 hypothetical protein B0W47_16540 [Komagataeibacter nataicola]